MSCVSESYAVRLRPAADVLVVPYSYSLQAVAMATLVRRDKVTTDLEGLLSILYRYFVQSAVHQNR